MLVIVETMVKVSVELSHFSILKLLPSTAVDLVI